MQILLLDDRIPDPHFGAGFPRAYRLLLSLTEMGHKVIFHPILKHTVAELNQELLGTYNIRVCTDIEKLAGEKIDVAIFSRPHNMHYFSDVVKKTLPQVKLIYDTEALWFRRYDLQLSITGRLPSWAYRYDELGLARKADLCFVVNDAEKKILEENGAKKVVRLGHALEIHRDGQRFEDRSHVLVVGGKLEEDSSNEDALWWYLENCWTGVKHKLNCNIDITGQVSTNRLRNNTFGNVNLMGHVNNLIPLYENHRVFVAATRFATGIPWKVHEAMAFGTPCVISKLLADQLGITEDKEALIANTPQEFIDQTVKLYENPLVWDRVREWGFDLVARDCDPNKFKEILSTNLDLLVAG